MHNAQRATQTTPGAPSAPPLGLTSGSSSSNSSSGSCSSESSIDSAAQSADHIITISTASITEAHSLEDTEQLKQQQQQQQLQEQKHLQQQQLSFHLEKPTLPHNAISPTDSSVAAGAAASRHTAKQKLRALCRLSQLVSFQNNIADVHHRRGRRLHGLQLPLHPLQLFGWLVLVLFGLASYCVLIPAFDAALQGPLYGLISGLYVVHIVSHLTALLTDPADKELRRVHRNDRIVPEFDRSRHAHVIENGRCHLCNIRTSSPRTKHCSVCNKCVGKFDHHCKWLNHCIGSRNYVAFLMCVVSAVVATLVIVAAVIAQIVLYYVQPEWLSFYWCSSSASGGVADKTSGATNVRDITIGSLDLNLDETAATGEHSSAGAVFNGSDFINLTLSLGNGTLMLLEEAEQQQQQQPDNNLIGTSNATALPTLLENLTTTLLQHTTPAADAEHNLGNDTAASPSLVGISVNETIFLILIGLLGLLAAVSAGLLLHLCFFHIYISFLGLTTYEYIRNHRQAQEAKAKQLLSPGGVGGVGSHALPPSNHSTLPKNGAVAVHFSPGERPRQPSKQTPHTSCAQIYCCASVPHPNAVAPDAAYDASYCDARKTPQSEQLKLQLHCCANSREYNQRSSRAYYVCSLLEERSDSPTALSSLAQQLGSGIGPYDASSGSGSLMAANVLDPVEQQQLRSFHCCSSFAASALQRRVSAATTKATLISDVEAAAAAAAASSLSSARTRSYLQYTEQCTFCTFRIRSPLLLKRSSGSANGTAASSSTRTLASQPASATLLRQSMAGSGSMTQAAERAEREHQRCCMKSISKHQRWRRKWNCCTSVPDSPDVPNDLMAALAFRQQSEAAACKAKVNAAELPVQFIRTLNGADSSPRSAASAGTLKSQASQSSATRIASNSRTWPVARLRHMMRLLGRYRRPRCRHHHQHGVAEPQHAHHHHHHHAASIKQNQIRPLQLQAGRHFLNGVGYYDSSTPQPPSTATATPTASELSSSSDGSLTPAALAAGAANGNELILPTSIIRDDSVTTYTLTLPPALPPPTRRKMPNPTDLEELAETLSFASHPSSQTSTSSSVQQQQQRLPALNNVYRRQRRKHFLRTRSPTLSPIHESGLSNPTSPQPCRHSTAGGGTGPATATNSSNCSPAVGRSSTALMNNLCGMAGEALRKAASNSSLQSVSSNSSST